MLPPIELALSLTLLLLASVHSLDLLAGMLDPMTLARHWRKVKSVTSLALTATLWQMARMVPTWNP